MIRRFASSSRSSSILSRCHRTGHGRRTALLACLLLVMIPALPGPGSVALADEKSDLAAARAVFRANLDAIRNQDTQGYLDCYWQDPALTRNGPAGITTGYAEWAPTVGGGWPEVFEGRSLQLVRLKPGLVFGSYRYRVRFDGVEQTGISERLFLDTGDGWKIAVTTAFPAPVGTPPPPLALVGATIVVQAGGRTILDGTVIVRDGRIECVGSRDACPVPEGIDTVDCAGAWIVPGFIVTHADPGAVDTREGAAWLAAGVTSLIRSGGMEADTPAGTSGETGTQRPRPLTFGEVEGKTVVVDAQRAAEPSILASISAIVPEGSSARKGEIAVFDLAAALAEGGLTPAQVLAVLTGNGALAAGREDLGALEAGRLADLLVLDRNPLAAVPAATDIRLVMRGGELRPAVELRRLN